MDNKSGDNNPRDPKVSSASSSSSDSSEEQDLFQLDPVASPAETKKPGDVRLPPRAPSLSPSCSTPKSPTMSGYDPNRIPAEVFNHTKSGSPVDWSVASNESLFSIHMGKSQELTAYYQAYTDYAVFPPLDSKEKDPSSSSGHAHTSAFAPPNAKGAGEAEDLRISVSGHSTDGSIASHQSFAFPILTNDAKAGSLKNELVRHQTPPVEQMQPLVPPSSEAPKEKQNPAPTESKTNTSASTGSGCFSCLPSFPPCCCWGSSTSSG